MLALECPQALIALKPQDPARSGSRGAQTLNSITGILEGLCTQFNLEL